MKDGEGRDGCGACGGEPPFFQALFQLGLLTCEGFLGVGGFRRAFRIAWAGATWLCGRLGRRVVTEPNCVECGLVEIVALGCESEFAVGDVAAVVGAKGVCGDREEAGFADGFGEAIEVAAVSPTELREDLAGGARALAKGSKQGTNFRAFRGIGLTCSGGRGVFRAADVADAAGRADVVQITKVPDECVHAAAGALGIGDDFVDLGAPVAYLLLVVLLPTVLLAEADGAVEVGGDGSLDEELVDALLDDLAVHLELALEGGQGGDVVAECLEDALDVPDGRIVLFEQELLGAAIGEAVEEDGAGWLAIAAGAADLLVVGLDGARQGGVNDGANVSFIDTHAEGDGGDDDAEVPGKKGALDAVAGGWVEAGVVGSYRKTFAEGACEFIRGLAGLGVDDGGAGGLGREELAHEVEALRLGGFEDFDVEIVAAEAGDEDAGVAEIQGAEDVLLHGRGGRGSERDDG